VPPVDLAGPEPVAFLFDLGSPFTYLAAERADRQFAELVWTPALAEAVPLARGDDRRALARADELGLPLIWTPEATPGSVRTAMRVASLAAERDVAAAFVLAATRLIYCGGFELGDPETIAEAAAAAGLDADETWDAAGDVSRDRALEDAACRAHAAGAAHLPAFQVGAQVFDGEERLGEAVVAARRLERRAG
jgi:2-hydroxychromene-2-carboxylate isomerase